MDVDVFLTPGLGDNSFLLVSDGQALLVDPQRDAGRMLEAVEGRGADLGYVLETHVHNDYVSGAAEVRARTGAIIAGPAGAGYAFEHLPLGEADEIRLGALRIVAMHTPGHTPEHVSYAVFTDAAAEPAAVFTGGSLIVGNAGRTDLLGEERTDELTRAQFRSLRRLAALSDSTLVLPTHGAGSFCAAGAVQEDRTSTIGRERASNPALLAEDEDGFFAQQLFGLMAFPAYYARMAPINRAGPGVVGDVPLPPALTAEQTAAELERGAALVDGREGAAFADEHVRGSVNVPLDDSFASYVGWVVPFDTPLVLVLPEPEDEALEDAATQLFRIGREPLRGYLAGGVDAWRAWGGELGSYPRLTADDLVAELREGRASGTDVLDVRQRPEWDAGHLSGSRHVFVGDLPSRIGEVSRDARLTVTCATGHRSSIAASLLDRQGVPVRLVSRGGIPRVLRRLA